MRNNGISRAVTKRLPRYYRYLTALKEQGVERISSKELSEKMKVTASQIRQDFSNFGGFGQQGYGYNVDYLYKEIGKILGLDTERKMVIIGAGRMGQALVYYQGFSKRGFTLTGIFDKAPSVIGTKVGDFTVQSLDELEQVIKDNDIKIAVIAVPKLAAQEVADTVCDLGVEGIWNFALVDLKVPSNCVVENVHLVESLMNLAYNISVKES
ncbi:MAG: redox-sensing transcriptional repressor Rex [Lachnospiraceae bacterium]|nr:redox-sensing transcriptional repressor Rex [Lachnospiraceae bacterium]